MAAHATSSTSPAVEQLKRHLAKRQLKLTRQRQIILERFLRADHITAEALHRDLTNRNMHLGLSTIYRTLNLLCEIGIAQPRHFGDARTLYDNVAQKKHHDHLICNHCGKIAEFECPDIERLQEEMARQNGFEIESHRLELYGSCSNCRG